VAAQRALLSWLGTLALASCVDRGPPAWAPTPSAPAVRSATCGRAEALRARAPAMLEEGKLDRVTRALARAEELCPMDAPLGWALRVRALAALGRSTEALQLAARIERSDRADDAARVAARSARAVAEAHAQVIVAQGSRHDAPELFDPRIHAHADADATAARAAAAAKAGDHASAKLLFLDAWRAARPRAEALVDAGLEARAEGKRAEAQELFDRAAYDDATVAPRPLVVDGAPYGHTTAAVAWSRGGEYLAVAGDRVVLVFDAALRPRLRVATRELVVAVAFSADAGRLLVALEGGAVQLFDTRSGVARGVLSGHTANVRALVASPDGAVIATSGDDGNVGLWSADDGARIGWLAPRRGARPAVTALAFDASGQHLAVGTEDGAATCYLTSSARAGDAPLGSLAARGGAIRALAFSEVADAGGALVIATGTELVRWDAPWGARARRTTAARRRSEAASFATGGGRLTVATLEGPALAVTNLAAKEDLASSAREAHEGLSAFALAPSGSVLAAVYRDRTLAILPAAERREPCVLSPNGPVTALGASADGDVLAASADGRALVWRGHGERLHAHEAGAVRALALSTDGSTLALGLGTARVVLRDLAGKRADVQLGTASEVTTLAFSPDGAHLAAGTAAPAVQLLDPAREGASITQPIASGPIHAVRFSPEGARVAIASADGLTLWNPGQGSAVRVLAYGTGVRDAAFTADGQGLVVVNQRGELLLGRGVANAPLPATTVRVPAQALFVAVARDGSLATAEGDRAIALRTAAGKLYQRFRDPDATVRALALLPRHAAAGLADGTVRLYRAPETGPVAILAPLPGLPPGKLAGIVRGPRGHLEVVGPDAEEGRAAVGCILGAVIHPLEVCAEQFVVDDLLATVLAGVDPAEADP
jgi:WD40 repeat protein